MTDIEYDAYFERKRKETIDKILGLNAKAKNLGYAEHTTPRKKSTMKTKRTYAEDLAMKWLAEYNEQRHANGGKIVTYVTPELNAEVLPPMKSN